MNKWKLYRELGVSEFKYFDRSDFDCQETGENRIPDRFIHRLDELRERCGFPLVVTSGYRSPQHSIEAAKDEPGEHTRAAADLAVNGGWQRYRLVREAMDMGFTGIGIAKTFIHLDDRIQTSVMWSY